jgi:hypothetical protein
MEVESMEKVYHTVAETAAILGISPRTIYNSICKNSVRKFIKPRWFENKPLFHIPHTRAAELVGYGKMQGTRVVKKLKKNAAFRAKVDNMILQSVDNYKKSTQSLLPEISELDVETIRQYKADPTLLVQRPKAIQNLRQVAGAVLPDGANITQVISVSQIETLQNIFQQTLLPGGDVVVDAEVVDADNSKDKA